MKGGLMKMYRQIKVTFKEDLMMKIKQHCLDNKSTMTKFVAKVVQEYFDGVKPIPMQEEIATDNNKPLVIIIK